MDLVIDTKLRPSPKPGPRPDPLSDRRTFRLDRGVAVPRRPAGRRPLIERPGRSRLAAIVLMLIGQVLILADLSLPLVRPALGAALLLGLPTVVLARRSFGRLRNRLVAWLLATGLTVLGLIVAGLVVNTVLPWFGASHPLARPVIVLASAVADTLLLLRRPAERVVDVRASAASVLAARIDPAVALGVAACVLAVAGAIRLNNGLGGAVAALAHATAVATLIVAMARRRISEGGRIASIYLAGLALLLGTSMRGWFIVGHDVQNEYLSFLLTHHTHHWVMSAYPLPYHACLSVNILPSVLVDYLGISGVFAFKVVLQTLFALVPLAVYALARTVVPARVAVLSAALFMIFPTFFTDMPFLVRQEVAYLFLMLAVLVARQRAFDKRLRLGLVFAFGVGVVLSHYSTTYMLFLTLIFALAGTGLGVLARRRRQRYATSGRQPLWLGGRLRNPERKRASLVLLSPVLIVALAVVAWAWSSPATHSGGHLITTVRHGVDSILHGHLPAGSSDLKYNPLLGQGPSQDQRWHDFLKYAASQRGDRPSAYVFPKPTSAETAPPLAPTETASLTGVGKAVDSIGINVDHAVNAARGLLAILLQLLLALGLIALALRARSTRRIDRELFWLMLGSVGALGFVALVPGASADYGVLRAFQQALLFAAPLMAIGLTTAAQRLHRAATPAVLGFTALTGLVLTGAAPAVLGGYEPPLSQSNSGLYYDEFYVTSPELAAAHWLGDTTASMPGKQYVAANGVNLTRLEMFVPKKVDVHGYFFASFLRANQFVFLGPQAVDRGQATVFYTGDTLTYVYPVAQLDQRMDAVYSTQGVRIYR